MYSTNPHKKIILFLKKDLLPEPGVRIVFFKIGVLKISKIFTGKHQRLEPLF